MTPADEDYSGADVNRSRPSFEKLIRDAENKRFDVVLCKTQARFTRDMEVLERYIHNKFPEWGIRFVTIVDRVDTADKGNKKSRQISWAPYGYKKSAEDNHKLVIDECAADVVKMIFRLYIDGYGVNKIIKILNEKGIDKPSIYMRKTGENFPVLSKNDFWCDSTVSRILKNEVYIGTLIQGKYTTVSYKNSKLIQKSKDEWIAIKNNHNPIIDVKDFYIVQEMISNNRRAIKYDNLGENIGKAHLFATKAKCAECGGPMVKTVFNNGKGKRYPYLRCKNHNVYAGQLCKYPNLINYDKLIEIVEYELKNIFDKYTNNKNVINAAAEKINITDYSEMIYKLNTEINSISNQINVKNKAIANLYVDKSDGIIDINKYYLLSEAIEEDVKKLTEKKEKLKNEIERLTELNSKRPDINEVINQFNINNGLTNQIVQETIEKIEIAHKKEGKRDVVIYWKI